MSQFKFEHIKRESSNSNYTSIESHNNYSVIRVGIEDPIEDIIKEMIP